ncbi:Hypothetical predicted protein [Pelobates cultripes]|uniref:Uncharacterized protein n=1 Tax=Pelobates cultripes TaxID=61616 RepID=A0AAD1RUF2_PELCU|nr:Hypothetical predicted protein [Pelobates cultripes]
MAAITAGGPAEAYFTTTMSKLNSIFAKNLAKLEARQQHTQLKYSQTSEAPTPQKRTD